MGEQVDTVAMMNDFPCQSWVMVLITVAHANFRIDEREAKGRNIVELREKE